MTTVVVSGALANKAGSGGEAWVRLSYVQGLRRLGVDVAFIEQAEQLSEDAVAYFRDVATQFGIEATLVDSAGCPMVGSDPPGGDLLINVSGNLRLQQLVGRFSHTAFVDIDPGFTQFWHLQGVERIPEHDTYFTIGANIGGTGCSIPTGGIEWRPTRPPVVLDEWPVSDGDSSRFTTVASWRGSFGPIEHEGRSYGLKVHEFRKFLPLPEETAQDFEIALDIDPADVSDRELLERYGWRLVDPRQAAGTPEAFRGYVHRSGAEFSVAQGIYVDTDSGWFSDRSVRYLASGKPVLVQDTGFSRNLPTGEGLLAFRTMEEAVEGVRRIVADREAHGAAARTIAEQHFNSDKVIARMLEECGLG